MNKLISECRRFVDIKDRADVRRKEANWLLDPRMALVELDGYRILIERIRGELEPSHG